MSTSVGRIDTTFLNGARWISAATAMRGAETAAEIVRACKGQPMLEAYASGFGAVSGTHSVESAWVRPLLERIGDRKASPDELLAAIDDARQSIAGAAGSSGKSHTLSALEQGALASKDTLAAALAVFGHSVKAAGYTVPSLLKYRFGHDWASRL